MTNDQNSHVARRETVQAGLCLTSPERSTGDLLLERDDFEIRVAAPEQANESARLVERMYAWRGYLCGANHGLAPNSNRFTLQACRGEHIFGTLGIWFDSDAGLVADALYRSEIDAYRATHAGVCELTRLAVDPEFGSKEVLGALFHVAYFFAGRVGCVNHMFIEVNPRHVAFYRRMLNFRAAGECKVCPRVDAPAVLMHLEVAHAADQIARYGGRPGAATRSLYPYFCSPEEDEEVSVRVARLRRSAMSEETPSAVSEAVSIAAPERELALAA